MAIKKRFKVTGLCIPEKHYMADTSDKIRQIMEMVDRGDYFTINRARQYGKTTTLNLLCRELCAGNEYQCADISFEGIDDESFDTPAGLCDSFTRLVAAALERNTEDAAYADKWKNPPITGFEDLSVRLDTLCRNKKIVLIIDEVDKASNNAVFLRFLGTLRDKYLLRDRDIGATFHSVILAGVYDVKNLKVKMVSEGRYTPSNEEGRFNSPWNIAADYDVDMSLSIKEISSMLSEYEADRHTGMDIAGMAAEIYGYTSGYPYLVSRICQRVDESLNRAWNTAGVQAAVKLILQEKSTLFDDLAKNMENYAELYDFVYSMLIFGESKGFQIDNPTVNQGAMFGIFKNIDGKVAIHNRIFETRIYDYFVSKDESSPDSRRIQGVVRTDLTAGGRLNMPETLRRFVEHFRETFTDKDIPFLEHNGKLVFLTYIKPVINGAGFYHVESETRDEGRMDIVIDYGKEQFILELKIWRGESKHTDAFQQLVDYLESKGSDAGYLLTFDLRKNNAKEPKAEWVEFGGKKIFDAIT